MLRTLLAAIAAICTIGLVGGAPPASAQPKFCEGSAYKTACAGGGGNGGERPYFGLVYDGGSLSPKLGANGKATKVCRSACSKVPKQDRVQNR